MPVTLFDYQSLQDDFDKSLKGRWVKTQNLHLTLQFFGDAYAQEYLLERLSFLDLQAEASEIKGLCLLNNDQILYAQTHNPSLQMIHSQIKKILPMPLEQEFIPHITLMRIKKIIDRTRLDEKIKAYEEEVIGLLHPKIELIQSTLTPQGAQYTLVKRFTP